MNTITNIFTSPGEAFRTLRERPSFLLPVAVLLAASVAVILWYYSAVDVVWMMERSLETSQAELPADQREQMLEQLGQAPRGVLAGTSAIAATFIVIVLLLLTAMYFSIVSMLTNDGLRFRQWFSLASWASLPVTLASVASLVNLALNDPTYLPAEELNPLAIRNLLELDIQGSGFTAALLTYGDVTSIWALALMVIGYRQWTGRDIAVSALIVTGPLLVIILFGLLL